MLQRKICVNLKIIELILYSQKDHGLIYWPRARWLGTINNDTAAKGTLYYNDGSRFEGEYNGKGTIYYKDGGWASGIIKNHSLEGFITYHFKSGNILEANFENGKVVGKGTMKFADGNKWVGELTSEGKPQGNGTLYQNNGSRWEGIFPTGYGCFYASNGERWQGYMHNGVLHGSGTYYWTNGDYFSGEMCGGQLQGAGSLYHGGKLLNGKMINGTFYKN